MDQQDLYCLMFSPFSSISSKAFMKREMVQIAMPIYQLSRVSSVHLKFLLSLNLPPWCRHISPVLRSFTEGDDKEDSRAGSSSRGFRGPECRLPATGRHLP